jgi:hypothetical protein
VGSPGTSGTAGSSGVSATATLQTGSIVKQTLWTNVTSGSTNTITGLSLNSNKWDVSVVEEWDAATLDQYYNSCSLLCHFDSLNPAGRFIDNSRNNFTVTSNGDSRLSTSQYKFGGASAYFDGTADNLLINYNTALHLSGDFTIEVWFYPITLNGGMILNFAGGLNIAWASYELVNNTDGINFAGSSANNGYDIGSETGATGRIGTVSVNTWNHIAVTRQGNVYRGYINGVQGYTQTLALTPYNPNARGLAIGSNYANTWGVTPVVVLNGYLDELRITKGVARYTSNFTPQNSPFPNSRNQVLTKYVGLVGGIDDKYVDYGVQKLSDTSLKLTRLTYPNQPLIGSGSLSGSVDRVYVNVLDYTRVSVTSSYARNALTASYILGGGANGSSGTSGGSGSSGSSGTSGNSGTSGSSGTSATAGSSGTSGSSGSSGTAGSSGTSGSSGSSGTAGSSGSSGSSGTSGVGSPGTSGTAGSSGVSGTATLQTGSIAKQTLWTNVTSGSTNTISGLSLSSNKWDVSVVEEWDAATLDQYYNSCSLLCHFDSLNAAGRFIDNSRNNFKITSSGNVTVDNNIYKFGGGSGLFDGTGDYLTTTSNSSFGFGTDDYTIEAWIYPTAIRNGENLIYATDVTGGTTFGFNQTQVYIGARAVAYDLQVTYTVVANTWTHLTATRQSGTVRIFANGNLISSGTVTRNCPQGPGAIGDYPSLTGNGVTGYIDEVRVTKGVARYTSNFTPRNSPFPNSRNQILTKYVGLVGGIDDKYVDYGVQKLSDTSLKLTRLTYPNQPLIGSGSLSGSVNRVYVNVLDYTSVSVTSSYSLLSKTASYALNASGGGGSTLRTGSLYPITASWSRRAVTASYALNGGTALVNQTMRYISGSNLYTLSRSVVSPSDVLLSVNGIIQTPTTDYTVSASSVTFTESYPSGSKINARYLVTATNSSDVNLANIVLTGTTTGDAYYPQVAALLHFDGVNGSTTITDNSKNNLAVTSVNGAFISTAQSKFGGASVFLDGTNDYVSVTNSTDFDFGAGDFTIEYWEYRTVSTIYKPVLSRNNSSYPPYMIGWSDTGNVYFYSSADGASWNVASAVSMGSIITNSWTHYAVTRQGNTFRTFQNGTQISTFTSTATLPAGAAALLIGVYASLTYFFQGYIDELRITKGYARYTGNFTPSTTAFSNTGGDVGKALVVNSTATGVSIGTAGFNLNSSNINRIINGAMAVDQRNAGAAQTITAAAALAYTVDRWYAYCTGANVTGQRVAGTGNNQFAYRFTGAASVTAIGFGQRIEAANSIDLAGSTATLGVDLANSLLTSVTWTAYYANTADTFGTLASPTRTQIATGTFTVTSTLTRYSAQIFIPSAAITGVEIVFSVGAQTSGTWTIDNVQLEAGPLATPFERRLFGLELLLCQRYFVSINGSTGTGSEFGTTSAYIKLPLSTWMRTDNQTVTLSTGNSISINLFGVGTSTTSTSNVTITANRAGIIFNINTLSPSQGATGTPAEILGTVSVSSEL